MIASEINPGTFDDLNRQVSRNRTHNHSHGHRIRSLKADVVGRIGIAGALESRSHALIDKNLEQKWKGAGSGFSALPVLNNRKPGGLAVTELAKSAFLKGH